MKKFFFSTLISLSALTAAFGQHAFLEQTLIDRLAEAGNRENIAVMALFEDAVDAAALKESFQYESIPVSERPRLVMRALKEKADQTQRPTLQFLAEAGVSESEVSRFWISNSIAFSANKAVIEALANRPEIARIMLDAPMGMLIAPEKGEPSEAKSQGGSEPGLSVIALPELWAMGYTGNGRLAMTFDTGVWPDHPALSARFLPNMMPISSTWFAYDSPLPVDKTSSHGTHVSGTMVGLDPSAADTIGGAFKAYLIATDPVVSNLAFVKPLSDFMFGYQWALNPDGDENTSDDVPDVINNSWGFGPDLDEAPCPEFVVPVFNAVEAAGIANVFSAGNEGPEPFTMSVPHNINTGLVNSFTVGAVNGNVDGPDYPIANFSSRGPSLCGGTGSLLIKPEVSAPGVNVRSSVGNGGYETFSGTSMASPHVSAAVLLLKEAFPEASGEEILLALYNTAIDLGEPGEDNTYGMGLINAVNAFNHLAETYDPALPASPEHDMELVSIDAPTLLFRCTAPGQLAVTPEITVFNKGSEPASGIAVEYRINGGEAMVYSDPDFSLAPGASAELTLAPIEAEQAGFTELHARILPHPDEYDKFNNNAVKRWTQLPEPVEGLSFVAEDFENGFDSTLWAVINPDLGITWDTAWVVQADGEHGYAARMRHGSYAPAAGQKDYLVGPHIFPEGQNGYTLSYDYYYRRRTNNPNNFDTLAVSIAYNCGEGVHELWRKGGEELYTNDVHLPDALPASADEWVNIQLNLNLAEVPDFNPDNGFYPLFTAVNRRGNNVLVDNVLLDFAANVKRTPPPARLSLAPNPARSEVRLKWTGGHDRATAAIFDTRGKLVLRKGPFDRNAVIDLSRLTPGVYIVEAQFENGEKAVEKLVVQ